MNFGDDTRSHLNDDDLSDDDSELDKLHKKPFEDVKFDFESNRGLNKDLHLLPNLQRKEDKETPVCKPDGTLIGQDNPFFQEERYAKKNLPPNVKYDVIGPLGSEPNPDIDTYPLHTSKKNSSDFPNFDFNKPNFGPGNPGSFGRFF
ncbi:hypothetical protein TpMuguga_02g00965 [Theileria parva strain Muguga]|uniref:uncharacterized protein n=1 Tax=Theileria parva strain Muguga TaxID=333668 RepID=UPI001C619DBA|nr:uncharacterized protein TpMuguga_02g00965 [Theileria parva strain Muguga]EAN32664.2 hypothetical protein TpMuguga_02g00965 [Theileria parva strain Muguga]